MKYLPLLVMAILATIAFGFFGCEEEAEDGDSDTDSVMDTEPEPNTELPPDPEDDGEPTGGGNQAPYQAQASRGF